LIFSPASGTESFSLKVSLKSPFGVLTAEQLEQLSRKEVSSISTLKSVPQLFCSL
jgi:hypothetical protein